MPLRFYRRKRLCPGLFCNLSKRGVSLTVGAGPFHYTVGRGRRRVTVGLPGTGIYYTKVFKRRKGLREGEARGG